MKLTGLLALVLAAPGAAGASGAPRELSFEKFAEGFQSRFNVSAEQGMAALREALDRSFLQVPLGLFDLYYPADLLGERDHAEQLQEIAAHVMEMQESWNEWVRDPEAEPAATGLEEVARWIRGWKSSSLAAAAREGGGPALERLKADEEEVAAVKEFAQYMRSGGAIGVQRAEATGVTLVLAPRREDFLQLAGFVGSVDTAARDVLWVDTLPVWTRFHFNDLEVLALEYATPDWKSNVLLGMDMNAREKTGLLQHVLQHATDLLCDAYLGDVLDPALASGIGIHMVIEMLKENNARAGGSGAANVTAAISKFIPGGNSSGGRLPPVNADSQWRSDKGKDHFVRALRLGQKEGAQLQKKNRKDRDPVASFALDPAPGATGTPYAVAAPFLGDGVKDKGISTEYLSDYQEFFRAYKGSFVHWLQQESDRDEKRAGAAFGRLLRECAAAAGTEDPASAFDAILGRIYGVPLSADDREADSLEWRFLTYLGKQ